MPSRAEALKDFYGGPVWKAHREAANATMIDSDNVLLLHPATPTSGFSLGNKERPRVGASEAWSELIVATIYYFDAPVDAGFVQFFEKTVKPMLADVGASVLAYFVTEHSENTFPALPVREGENVFVWFARFNDPAAYERHIAALTESPRWRDEISKELAHMPEARAGDFEIIANDALAFVKTATIFRADKDRYHFDTPSSVFSSKLIFTS